MLIYLLFFLLIGFYVESFVLGVILSSSVLLVFDLLSKSSASKLEGCYNFIVYLYRMNAVLKDGDQCGYLQDCS